MPVNYNCSKYMYIYICFELFFRWTKKTNRQGAYTLVLTAQLSGDRESSPPQPTVRSTLTRTSPLPCTPESALSGIKSLGITCPLFLKVHNATTPPPPSKY